MRPIAIVLLMTVATVCHADPTSELWGADGSTWSAKGRLPDFSFAGYRRGEVTLPSEPVTHTVLDFGAIPNDDLDDSDAFLKAIEAVNHGVLLVPEGRYIISKMLVISKPGVVIRGEGPDKTTLYFPIPLNDIKPNWGATTGGQRTSNYSWSGGFLSITGSFQRKLLSSIDAVATRGDYQIQVADASALSVGQEIEIRLEDIADNSLANHLYSGDPRTPLGKLNGRVRASLVTRITAINGETLTFDRPLRFDIEARWTPGVYRFEPTVTDSGIESLRFEFPNTPYEGHFTELGFNAFALGQVAHCWVRNVHIHNADSGGFVSGNFNTVDSVTYTSERRMDKNRQSAGHHGLTNGGDDNVFSNFDFQSLFIHDITVSRSSGNVQKNGRGIDLALDHHRHAPYENLFTNIHTGAGTRVWRSGGGSDLGAHCAARGTFWNITADNPIEAPDSKFGPWSMNLVGVQMNQDDVTRPDERWYEHSQGEAVLPVDLHAAQLQRRMGNPLQTALSTVDGFTSLFSGTDFTGWEGNLEFFRIEDGAVIAGRLTERIPRNEFLCSTEEYGDFELRLQVKASQADVNGGIQIRSQRVPNHHEVSGYQVDTGLIGAKVLRNMVDEATAEAAHVQTEGSSTIWGSLYDESRRNRFLAIGDQATVPESVRPTEWNDFVIRCEGPRIQIWVNDVQTVDFTEADDSIPRTGIIGLQIHSGPAVEIGYRNIEIKDLSTD